jgi:hypothetical protein
MDNTKVGIVPITLTEIQASIYLGISRATLRQGRCEGRREKRMPPPPFVRLGRKIIYLRTDLDRWLESYRITL